MVNLTRRFSYKVGALVKAPTHAFGGISKKFVLSRRPELKPLRRHQLYRRASWNVCKNSHFTHVTQLGGNMMCVRLGAGECNIFRVL